MPKRRAINITMDLPHTDDTLRYRVVNLQEVPLLPTGTIFTSADYMAWRDALLEDDWQTADNKNAERIEGVDGTHYTCYCAAGYILSRVYKVPDDMLLTRVTVTSAIRAWRDKYKKDCSWDYTPLQPLLNVANIFDRFILTEETRSVADRKREAVIYIESLIVAARTIEATFDR